MADNLRTVTLGESGLEASVIGYGTYHLGDKLDEYDAVRSMGRAFDRGVTLFDTSDNYGTEGLIGIAVREGYLPRDEVVIATKTGLSTSYDHQVTLSRAGKRADTSPPRIREQVDKSLTILGKAVGVIDLYQLHVRDDTVEPVEHAATMSELIEAGKIRAYGVSNYSAEDLEELVRACDAEGLPRPVASQPFFNLVEGPTDAIVAAHSNKLAVLAHSPLLKGILTESTINDLTTAVSMDEEEAGDDIPEGLKLFKRGLDRIKQLQEYGQNRGLTLSQLAISWVTGYPSTVALTACSNERYLNDAITGADYQLDMEDADLNRIIDGFDEAAFVSMAINVMRDRKYYYR